MKDLDNMLGNILQIVGAVLTLTSGLLKQMDFEKLKDIVSLRFYSFHKDRVARRNKYYINIGVSLIIIGYICATMGWNLEEPKYYLWAFYALITYVFSLLY